jgi:HlyD family secretion protein
MKAIVSVDEADIGGVKENQKVIFTVDAYPKKQFEGKIIQLRLNSAIVSGVVTYEAVVQVNNNDLLLRPGMTASASIITDTLKNVLVVPNSALRFSPPIDNDDTQKKKKHAIAQTDQGDHIWVLKNNIPSKIKVQLGKSNGIMSIISAPDLKIGDLIITGVDEQP